MGLVHQSKSPFWGKGCLQHRQKGKTAWVRHCEGKIRVRKASKSLNGGGEDGASPVGTNISPPVTWGGTPWGGEKERQEKPKRTNARTLKEWKPKGRAVACGGHGFGGPGGRNDSYGKGLN